MNSFLMIELVIGVISYILVKKIPLSNRQSIFLLYSYLLLLLLDVPLTMFLFAVLDLKGFSNMSINYYIHILTLVLKWCSIWALITKDSKFIAYILLAGTVFKLLIIT